MCGIDDSKDMGSINDANILIELFFLIYVYLEKRKNLATHMYSIPSFRWVSTKDYICLYMPCQVQEDLVYAC